MKHDHALGRSGMRVFWFSLCLSLCLAIQDTAKAHAVQPTFPLHTSGAYIVDADSTRVRLNAFNWYGAESKDYVVAGLQTADLASIVQTIKNMGFNTARIPWSNEMYESNPVVDNSKLTANTSLQGQTALAILDEVINALTDAGIMVILDNHNSNAEWCCGDDGNTLWYNSNYPESNWLSDWEGIVARYQTNSLVIGADLRNEPRMTATWGGDASTDWHAAAQRGGNAVLAVNPNLLILVEGINYSLDLSGVSSSPIELNVANHLVYSHHDYAYDYSGLTTYSSYINQVNTRWGYLVTQSSPLPVWLGEFGTCNTATSCITSTSNSDNGMWFNYLTTYLQQYSLDWSYWAINGTESTGSGRTYGSAESYGVLNTVWNGSASTTLTSRLSTMMTAASGFALLSSGNIQIASAGSTGSGTVTVVPQNGFVGTLSLSCAVASSLTTSATLPTCSVPTSVSITNNSSSLVTVSVVTASKSGKFLDPRLRKMSSAVVFAFAGLCLFIPRRRFRGVFRAVLPCAILLTGTFGCASCNGSSSSSSSSGTTAGTYTITVTAISGTTTASVQINAVVQ